MMQIERIPLTQNQKVDKRALLPTGKGSGERMDEGGDRELTALEKELVECVLRCLAAMRSRKHGADRGRPYLHHDHAADGPVAEEVRLSPDVWS